MNENETEVIEYFSYVLNRGVSIVVNTADICRDEFISSDAVEEEEEE